MTNPSQEAAKEGPLDYVPVVIHAPTKDGRYWNVLLGGSIVALCPTDYCAKWVADGLIAKFNTVPALVSQAAMAGRMAKTINEYRKELMNPAPDVTMRIQFRQKLFTLAMEYNESQEEAKPDQETKRKDFDLVGDVDGPDIMLEGDR
jgi:hypothetical protein